MTAPEARALVGQFGKIHANGDNYPKEIYGRITDVDRTSLEFTDNNDFLYIFKVAKVISFVPLEFVDKSN